MKDYTLIYSSGSIQALEELLNEFLTTFNISLTIEDLFSYGVFCQQSTYAFFKDWEKLPKFVEIPSMLTNPCNTPSMKIEYVTNLIYEICIGNIKKPEWMVYIEMEENCTEYELQPSTFLYIYAKENKYNNLAQKILRFLYSPNMMTKFVEDNHYE